MKLNVYIIHVLPLEKDDPAYDPDFLEWEVYIGNQFIHEDKHQWEALFEISNYLCRMFEQQPYIYFSQLLNKVENLTINDLREYFVNEVEFIEREVDQKMANILKNINSWIEEQLSSAKELKDEEEEDFAGKMYYSGFIHALRKLQIHLPDFEVSPPNKEETNED